MRFRTAPTPSRHSRPRSSAEGAAEPGRAPGDRSGLAIYIHWPYCVSKCPYCDFNSHARRTIGEEEFLKAARAELRHYAGRTAGRLVTSIFFGGGTPSLMAPTTVAALLAEIASLWPVEQGCEITLEANPSSADAGRFAGYSEAGVNRLSLGIQSFDDDALRFLGRAHSTNDARQALDTAARYFTRFSFDLIYALPGQTEDAWRRQLSAAIPLAMGHLSLYQLTIEPGTPFDADGTVVDPDLQAEFYEQADDVLQLYRKKLFVRV